MLRLLRKKDTGRLTAFLMRREAANTFLLGNLLAYGVEDDGRTFRRGDYWGFFSGEELTGAVAFFNNSQCMVCFSDPSMAPAVADLVTTNDVRIVLGPDDCIRPLLPALRGVPGRMAVRRQLFMRHEQEPFPGPHPSGLVFEDARKLAGRPDVQLFILRCMKEGFGYSVARSTVKRLLREKTEFEPYLLVNAAGRFVAQAHIQTRTPGYCQIGGVCTLPEERGRGYGSAVVRELMGRIALDGGRQPCLVVDEDNAAARRLYDGLGFREAGRLMLVDYL